MHMGKCQEKGHLCWSTKESFLVKCNPQFITCWHQFFFASPIKQCTWEYAKKRATYVGQQRNLSLWNATPHSLLISTNFLCKPHKTMHMGKCQKMGHPCWSTKESFLVKWPPSFITFWPIGEQMILVTSRKRINY